jgi:DNA-directed RNA polymerase omega subunit
MTQTDKTTDNGAGNGARTQSWSDSDSRFRLIVVATLRAKQLLHGARPRIAADTLRRRHTSIALEEVRQGLVPYTLTDPHHKQKSDSTSHE